MSVKQISDKEILSMYLNYERVEKGLSLNTLESYGRDLAIYLDFLSRNKKSILKVSRSDIEKFLDEKNKAQNLELWQEIKLALLISINFW